MDKNDISFNPVKMLQGDREVSGEFNFRICSNLEKYTRNFHGLEKMNDYQVKLYPNDIIKPVNVSLGPIPYHLNARVDDVIELIIKEDIIEETLPNPPAP